ncbi:class I SAM-dependent methyltransferase [Anaerocolumna xylanovorans]|uniref:2-polyprenyl-3-methyl-5-hydroxy-6-metoxy-1,4-benzoquinol methylase n=1 Tax=Anaerocolumna xylanovorans DSM 12503 TaxID=1121345 RepID=A0A1M7YG10_9FIRM|nr:class I SAM-dependent methyltransferase [Anaerocolumna xylanovorans]SHO51587.1 2-polyprenyl-3-methyl-5-hydroxy-6-metoxy-1,4-benzoquinol methylase [Anaerocolumna xylanovorans DSM 12503]
MENKEKIINAYASGNEINRAAEAGTYGMEFINTKKILKGYIARDKRVLEIGCGGGYYGMYFAASCQEYTGVDLSPANIQVFKELIKEKGYDNVKAEVGDATDLCSIEDNSFDVVLCLGPMYHLNPEGRSKCMAECERICKPGGTVAIAFINKAGVIAKFAPVFGWDKILTSKIDDYVLTQGIDDINPDIFFYTMPEEMIAESMKAGLTYERLAGLDFLLSDDVIANLSEEQRKVWFHLSDLIVASEYCTGLANHAMLICRKQ